MVIMVIIYAQIIDVLETSLANGGFCSPAGYAAEAKVEFNERWGQVGEGENE